MRRLRVAKPPVVYAYVRLAVGPGARSRLEGEAAVYAGAVSYRAHFERMGIEPRGAGDRRLDHGDGDRRRRTERCRPAARGWEGAVDAVVFRALPAGDTLADHLELVDAGAPEVERWS